MERLPQHVVIHSLTPTTHTLKGKPMENPEQNGSHSPKPRLELGDSVGSMDKSEALRWLPTGLWLAHFWKINCGVDMSYSHKTAHQYQQTGIQIR